MTNTITPAYSANDLAALVSRQADASVNRYICIEDKSVLTATEEGLCCPKCSYVLERVPSEAYVVVNKTTGKKTHHSRYEDQKKHMKKQ